MLRDEPLRNLLDSLSSEGDAVDGDEVAGLRRVADSLCSTPKLLTGSLTSIIDDEDRLHEVARRSSVHPNGFAKVVPFHTVPARLHVWPSGGQAGGGESVAHGHRWNFASWVIVGALRETMFEIDRSGDPVSGYAYGRRPDGESFLQPSGRTGLSVRSRRCRPAGCVYTRRRTDLHSAEPVGDGLVASFVVQGRRTTTPTSVYRRGEATPPDERTLRPDELKGLLADVVDVLRPGT